VQLRVPATALPRSADLRFDFLAHFPALSAYDRTPHTSVTRHRAIAVPGRRESGNRTIRYPREYEIVKEIGR